MFSEMPQLEQNRSKQEPSIEIEEINFIKFSHAVLEADDPEPQPVVIPKDPQPEEQPEEPQPIEFPQEPQPANEAEPQLAEEPLAEEDYDPVHATEDDWSICSEQIEDEDMDKPIVARVQPNSL